MKRLDLLQIDLTNECPLFCAHCSNSSGPAAVDALNCDVVERALLDASHLGCQTIIFSGGEPLRYRQLERLIRFCEALGMQTTLFTTGIRDNHSRRPLSLMEWKVMRLAGLQRAVFSVYAGPNNRALHNQVVRLRPLGIRDAFEANELSATYARPSGIVVEAHFIPRDLTCSDLFAIWDRANELGFDRLHLQYPTIQGRNIETGKITVGETGEAQLKAQALELAGRIGSKLHLSRLWRTRLGIDLETDHPLQSIVRSDGIVVPCNACK